MLYDEVVKLTEKAKVPAKFKFEVLQKTNANMKEISNTAQDALTAQKQGINDAKVFLIEDSKCSFDEVDKLKLEEFKQLKFPFDNFFVEFEIPNEENDTEFMTIGIHLFSDNAIGLKTQNLYNICVYSMHNKDLSSIIPMMAILKMDMLPRFYVGCPKKCDSIINPTNLGKLINNEVCQRTERTAKNCSVADITLLGIKILMYVVNIVNSKPQNIQGYKVKKKIKEAQSKHYDENNKNDKYIYIKIDKLTQTKIIRPLGDITAHRKSPKAHARRGHYRKLHSGKVIWVNMSYIGLKEQANAHKKIYKLK